MSEESPEYGSHSGSRLAPCAGSVSAGAAASGDAPGLLGLARDRDSSPLTPYYRDAFCTIYHGDCLEVLPVIKGVDVVIADPPYGVGLAEWDRLPTQEELDAFLCVGNGKVAMFGAARPDCVAALLSLKPLCNRIFVWHNTFTLTNSDGSFWQWQPLYTWGKPFKNLGRDVLTFPATDCAHRWHPAQKSDKLMRTLVEGSEGVILDPFMGSGTTLRAAKDLCRLAIGIEREERYCEIAARRLQQEVLNFTPRKADEAGDTGLLVPREPANTNSAHPEASQRQNDRTQPPR